MTKKEKKKEMSMPELRQLLREKKNHDQEFAKLMEEQPNLALEKCLGEKIPENFKVHFVEDTLDKLYVVLPANPEELSDEMLELVSGGLFSGLSRFIARLRGKPKAPKRPAPRSTEVETLGKLRKSGYLKK